MANELNIFITNKIIHFVNVIQVGQENFVIFNIVDTIH